MISFVVPAHNEERLLPATLASIGAAAAALREPHEIVVVDDASTDATAAVAARAGARVLRIDRRQSAAARPAGAAAARGDRLVFVDADTVIDAAVLGAAVDALRAGAAGGGAGIRFDGTVPRWARVVNALLVRAFRAARLACGCFLFCTRAAFDAAGGFDERLFGAEEIALSRALRRQGRFVVLRHAVTTSGRKLRAYSGWEIFCTLTKLLLRGRRALQSRRGLDMWYGERREDPGAVGHGVYSPD